MAEGSRERGQQVEALIGEWLDTQGLTLLERNYVRRVGEIDLIMREPHTGRIVFVEVRYRDSDAYGSALESVDTRKQSKLLRTAAAWLQKYADDRTHARFDVIAVCPDAAGPDAGSHQQPPLPGEANPVSWKGLRILWIRDAIQTA